jgi:hypothetical protein
MICPLPAKAAFHHDPQHGTFSILAASLTREKWSRTLRRHRGASYIWRMSTTTSSTEATKASTLDDLASKGIIFPNMGKSLEELPPRMRFAPSPTGRLVTLIWFC